MYVYLCMYIFMCIHKYIDDFFVFKYVYKYIYIYVFIFMYLLICIYRCIYRCICVYIYNMYIKSMYMYIYICICIYMYIYIYTYVYIYMYICIYVHIFFCNITLNSSVNHPQDTIDFQPSPRKALEFLFDPEDQLNGSIVFVKKRTRTTNAILWVSICCYVLVYVSMS